MDLIERRAAIDALRTCYDTETVTMDNGDEYINYEDAVGEIEQLPPAQPAELETLIKALEIEHQRLLEMQKALPEIIYCKDCRKHNKKVGFDENFHTVWKEDACPLVSWRGKAQEHEFDYQYCVFAERRTDG